MDNTQKADFALAIGAMLETFGREATKPLLHGYWIGLNDLDLNRVQTAVVLAIRECKSLPSPNELRRLVGAEFNDDERSIAAWNDALKAVPLGPYRHVDFQDKTINAVIRHLGGWVTFLDRFQDSDGEKWTRLEFIRAYKNMHHTGVTGDAIKPLPGLSQVSVVNGNVLDPIPRLIACDATRANVRLLGGSLSDSLRIRHE